MNHAAEMAAFDRLPRDVRARLAASRFALPAKAIAEDKRAHRLDERETVAFIAELERWAAEAERDAIAGGGACSNRLEPRRPPCAEEIVERIRG